jgi:hypothetical protein
MESSPLLAPSMVQLPCRLAPPSPEEELLHMQMKEHERQLDEQLPVAGWATNRAGGLLSSLCGACSSSMPTYLFTL